MSVVASKPFRRPVRISVTRLVAAAAIGLVAVLLLVDLAALLRAAAAILRFPYSIDYGEGIVWQQTRDTVSGEAYGPLAAFPAVVYHYPPVFYLLAGGLALGSGLDGLLAGRLVSLLGTLGSAVLVGWLAAAAVRDESRRIRLVCGTLAALACFTSFPIVFWAPMMRVDTVACLFGLAGLVLVAKAIDRPSLIFAAAVAFVLAVYAKQTSIAAPAAAFIVLLRVRPALAWRLALGCFVLGSIVLAAVCGLTDGRFARHIFLYNINRLNLDLVSILLKLVAMHGCLIAIAVLGLVETRQTWLACWKHRIATSAEIVPLLALVFLALKTAMLPLMLKSGASSNYLIEWVFALAILVGPAVRPWVSIAFGQAAFALSSTRSLSAGGAVAALGLAAGVAFHWPVDERSLGNMATTLRLVVDMIAASPRPAISDDMTLQIRAGQKVMWEPSIAAELAHAGIYDEAGFVKLVREKAFSLFLTEGVRGDWLFDQRFNPAVAAAIEDAYPVKRTIGRYTLHLPAD